MFIISDMRHLIVNIVIINIVMYCREHYTRGLAIGDQFAGVQGYIIYMYLPIHCSTYIHTHPYIVLVFCHTCIYMCAIQSILCLYNRLCAGHKCFHRLRVGISLDGGN